MNEPIYNCGCFWWMHDTVDTCDLYLPERKPARRACPLVEEYSESLSKRLEAARLAEQAAYARMLVNMPECNRVLYANQTATGAQVAYQQTMQNVVYAKSGTGALG